ncbi:YdcF family protein [Brachyspira alvinipulli]|uniref:YdcF family protein n=1 Tax=Brachyspira alvinipulli TaxID=84379 RepID=UPI0030068582
MNKNIADYINIVSDFCGKRDIDFLTREELYKKYNINKADVMVLFGGSIIAGGDVLADAIKNNIADKYIIVGGAGHTTDSLRVQMRKELPNILIDDKITEAEMFNNYIDIKYGLKADFLELKSTNCGNNITYMLELLKENNIHFKSIIISQDASMQHRMEAVLRKYISDEILIINYAAYKARVINSNNKLIYEKKILGMWNIDKYISLLMGEIQRLNDDENGYGPKGKDFIVHVDIPDNVMNAFHELKKEYIDYIREANPLYS